MEMLKRIDLTTYVTKFHLAFFVTYPFRTPELSVLELE